MKNLIKQFDDLELFENKKTKPAVNAGPFVSLSKNKFIRLSLPFCREAKEQLDGKTHVFLYYSKSSNCIIFDFTDVNDSKTLKLSRSEHGYITISGAGFINFYAIDILKYAKRYQARLEDINGVGKKWVVYL